MRIAKRIEGLRTFRARAQQEAAWSATNNVDYVLGMVAVELTRYRLELLDLSSKGYKLWRFHPCPRCGGMRVVRATKGRLWYRFVACFDCEYVYHFGNPSRTRTVDRRRA